jgi:hypothetical protein
MTRTGSLLNQLAQRSTQAHADRPAVGDGATIVRWTDRGAATVIEVVSDRHIRIQHDAVTYAYPAGTPTSIKRDPNGRVDDVRRGKDGRWAISWSRDTTVMIGVRDPHYDHQF